MQVPCYRLIAIITPIGTNDFHISATYNNEHLPMSLEEAEKNVHNYLDRIKRKMKRETGEDLKYMLVTEYTPEEEGRKLPDNLRIALEQKVAEGGRF